MPDHKTESALDEAMDALDSALKWVPVDHDERVAWRKRVEVARVELSALRSRAEAAEARAGDLELLVRWFMARHSGWDPPYSSESGKLECHDGRDGGSFFVIEVDASGLPLLDSAARAALKAGGGK